METKYEDITGSGSDDDDGHLAPKENLDVAAKAYTTKGNRAQRNTLERKRKGKIIMYISQLKEMIPIDYSPSVKRSQSNNGVLEQAVMYMRHLQEQCNMFYSSNGTEAQRSEINRLKAELAAVSDERDRYERMVNQAAAVTPTMLATMPTKCHQPAASEGNTQQLVTSSNTDRLPGKGLIITQSGQAYYVNEQGILQGVAPVQLLADNIMCKPSLASSTALQTITTSTATAPTVTHSQEMSETPAAASSVPNRPVALPNQSGQVPGAIILPNGQVISVLNSSSNQSSDVNTPVTSIAGGVDMTTPVTSTAVISTAPNSSELTRSVSNTSGIMLIGGQQALPGSNVPPVDGSHNQLGRKIMPKPPMFGQMAPVSSFTLAPIPIPACSIKIAPTMFNVDNDSTKKKKPRKKKSKESDVPVTKDVLATATESLFPPNSDSSMAPNSDTASNYSSQPMITTYNPMQMLSVTPNPLNGARARRTKKRKIKEAKKASQPEEAKKSSKCSKSSKRESELPATPPDYLPSSGQGNDCKSAEQSQSIEFDPNDLENILEQVENIEGINPSSESLSGVLKEKEPNIQSDYILTGDEELGPVFTASIPPVTNPNKQDTGKSEDDSVSSISDSYLTGSLKKNTEQPVDHRRQNQKDASGTWSKLDAYNGHSGSELYSNQRCNPKSQSYNEATNISTDSQMKSTTVTPQSDLYPRPFDRIINPTSNSSVFTSTLPTAETARSTPEIPRSTIDTSWRETGPSWSTTEISRSTSDTPSATSEASQSLVGMPQQAVKTPWSSAEIPWSTNGTSLSTSETPLSSEHSSCGSPAEQIANVHYTKQYTSQHPPSSQQSIEANKKFSRQDFSSDAPQMNTPCATTSESRLTTAVTHSNTAPSFANVHDRYTRLAQHSETTLSSPQTALTSTYNFLSATPITSNVSNLHQNLNITYNGAGSSLSSPALPSYMQGIPSSFERCTPDVTKNITNTDVLSSSSYKNKDIQSRAPSLPAWSPAKDAEKWPSRSLPSNQHSFEQNLSTLPNASTYLPTSRPHYSSNNPPNEPPNMGKTANSFHGDPYQYTQFPTSKTSSTSSDPLESNYTELTASNSKITSSQGPQSFCGGDAVQTLGQVWSKVPQSAENVLSYDHSGNSTRRERVSSQNKDLQALHHSQSKTGSNPKTSRAKGLIKERESSRNGLVCQSSTDRIHRPPEDSYAQPRDRYGLDQNGSQSSVSSVITDGIGTPSKSSVFSTESILTKRKTSRERDRYQESQLQPVALDNLSNVHVDHRQLLHKDKSFMTSQGYGAPFNVNLFTSAASSVAPLHTVPSTSRRAYTDPSFTFSLTSTSCPSVSASSYEKAPAQISFPSQHASQPVAARELDQQNMPRSALHSTISNSGMSSQPLTHTYPNQFNFNPSNPPLFKPSPRVAGSLQPAPPDQKSKQGKSNHQQPAKDLSNMPYSFPSQSYGMPAFSSSQPTETPNLFNQPLYNNPSASLGLPFQHAGFSALPTRSTNDFNSHASQMEPPARFNINNIFRDKPPIDPFKFAGNNPGSSSVYGPPHSNIYPNPMGIFGGPSGFDINRAPSVAALAATNPGFTGFRPPFDFNMPSQR